MALLSEREVLNVVLEKPVNEFEKICPLHYFTFSKFKHLINSGDFKRVSDDTLFFSLKRLDFIEVRTNPSWLYDITFSTTLEEREIEEMYSHVIRKECKLP